MVAEVQEGEEICLEPPKFVSRSGKVVAMSAREGFPSSVLQKKGLLQGFVFGKVIWVAVGPKR